MSQATDVVNSELYEEDQASKRPAVEYLEETPLDDHLFNAILAATPDTNFINGTGVAAAIESGEASSTPPGKPKPLVVRTLHPKLDQYGNTYIPQDIFGRPQLPEDDCIEGEDCSYTGCIAVYSVFNFWSIWNYS